MAGTIPLPATLQSRTAAHIALGAQRVVPHRTQPVSICTDHASSPSRRHPHDLRRPLLGQLDAPHPPLTARHIFVGARYIVPAHVPLP